ncbi:uncharacterized protein TRIADDRAFT_1653, partial [Trichoplax adhaerens]
ITGCFRPIWSVVVGQDGNVETDAWEVPFEDLGDLKWLGSGSQGAVFRGALHGQNVAVKKVRDEKDIDIKPLRKLQHPNIIRFLGVCVTAPCYCIIMEYCSNGALYDLIHQRKRELVPTLIIKWAKELASGMNYLHSHKIIHRDLKSPNVLLSNEDTLKLSDFGTFTLLGENSTKMTFAGTVAWMAPEVIRSEPCSEKVDVWSFGVVLWELVTGEIPYKDVPSATIMYGVGTNSLQLPIPSTCPDGLKLLMKVCWNGKPRNRPSFQQILSHLEVASVEFLSVTDESHQQNLSRWREEIKQTFEKIKSRGHKLQELDEELLRKRREELSHAEDVRKLYEERLSKANDLYDQLSLYMTRLDSKANEV